MQNYTRNSFTQVKQRKPVHILQNIATVSIKPIKPIHVVQNAATVPKKPKKPIPQDSWGKAPGSDPQLQDS